MRRSSGRRAGRQSARRLEWRMCSSVHRLLVACARECAGYAIVALPSWIQIASRNDPAPAPIDPACSRCIPPALPLPASAMKCARQRAARRAAGGRAPVDRPDRFRRQRHRRPPRHRDAGLGRGRHRAVLAADDGADGHADVAAAVGVATRWRRSPRRDRAAVPAGAVAVGGLGRAAVRLPQRGRRRAGADGHRGRRSAPARSRSCTASAGACRR